MGRDVHIAHLNYFEDDQKIHITWIEKVTILIYKRFSNEVVSFIWTNTVMNMADLIKNGSQEICITVFKAIEDLLAQSNCVKHLANNRFLGWAFHE